MAVAWDLSALRSVGNRITTLGLSNLDVDDEMFGAGAGDLLEAELFEDWVTTDSRRFLSHLAAAGSAWVAPTEVIPATPLPATPLPPVAPEPEPKHGTEHVDETHGPVGGARDEKGCLTSAGYSWCAAKESCIRFFEEDCLADEPAALETDEFGCSTGQREMRVMGEMRGCEK